ncbi:hypothetical protein, partial [Staphylococcus aureus]|uniref:hypothetical protein n=1 Tax=Staphylococcus aureus TaxID=1280 RepID=UPI0039BEA856
MEERIFIDPCRILRCVRFTSTLPGFTIHQEVQDYILEKGNSVIKDYKKTFRICLDAMSMLSSDNNYLDAFKTFLNLRLVEGVLSRMKIDTDIYTKAKRRIIEEKLNMFFLLENCLHSQSYVKRNHYWMILH